MIAVLCEQNVVLAERCAGLEEQASPGRKPFLPAGSI